MTYTMVINKCVNFMIMYYCSITWQKLTNTLEPHITLKGGGFFVSFWYVVKFYSVNFCLDINHQNIRYHSLLNRMDISLNNIMIIYTK
jgi:hypothetical protein